jgi:vitamin B12 transporter
MIKNFVTVVCGFFSLSIGFSQEEPKIKELEELEITVTKLNKYYTDSTNVYITRQEIDALQPDDLGELLKKLPGVNVKSYGGLGGLKTFSIRGLGGQHTNFVMDGFSQTQTQTGQINLGQIQMDNIETVIVQRGGASEISIPVAAQISGNAIILESFQSIAPTIPLQQKLLSKFGSFGQVDQHFIGKTGGQKVYGGVFFKYRKTHGIYPYRYMNYQTEVTDTRKNNDYTDINGGFNLRVQPHKNHQINFYFQYFESQQGVPGAVVLYNDFAKQRLNTTNTQIKADYKGKIRFLNYRFYYSTMGDSLFYYDPTYLNNAGELRADYFNRTHDFGMNLSATFWKKLHLNLGAQEIYSKLRSTESFSSSPERFHFYSFVKATFSSTRLTAIAQIGLQHIEESNKNGEKAKNLTKTNPYLEVRYAINEKITLVSYYRNSFRMPNFNELYYNNIGNVGLKPEEANQISLAASWTIVDRNRIYLGLQGGAYYNQVKNMILSVPTKNLFVWSIQNVGKNEVKGFDVIGSFSLAFGKSWSTQLTANYTYQQSLDISDKNSPSYRHQVAYNPLHVVNADLSLHYKNLGIRVSSFHSSDRFALNENIAANRVAGFSTFDLSVFNRFQLDKNNSIRLQITIKNIGDASYAYVKNYIMPGRHFLFTFVYAFI